MALALFADDDYEEVAARLTENPAGLGLLGGFLGGAGRRGGITQARQAAGAGAAGGAVRPGWRPRSRRRTRRGRFLGPWRLMSGRRGWSGDVPATPANAAAFGYSGAGGAKAGGVPEGAGGDGQRVRLACGGWPPRWAPGGGGESPPRRRRWARTLYPLLEEGWLVLADRKFLRLGRLAGRPRIPGRRCCGGSRRGLRLPVLEVLPDGSWRSVLINPKINKETARARITAGRPPAAEDLDQEQGPRYVRVIEYQVPDRDGKRQKTSRSSWSPPSPIRGQAPAAILAPGLSTKDGRHETGTPS